MEHSNVISLVKSLSRGRCGCYQINGSLSIGAYDPLTGAETPFKSTHGDTIKCQRCIARAALEADGIDYEKVDHLPTLVHNGNINCAPSIPPGTSFGTFISNPPKR